MVNYLKSIAIFSCVVETGSFTAAGEKLLMPRGKVSEQVARLEAHLGVKLLQRSTRKVVVTKEGVAFHQKVKSILPSAIEGLEEVKSFEDDVKGAIKITTTQDQYETLLLPILKEFTQQYPLVTFDFLITDQTQSIIDDSIDLAIRSGDLPDSNLIAKPLVMTKLKLYASPNMAGIPQSIKELAECAWVNVKMEQVMTTVSLVDEDGNIQAVMPNYVHQANNIASYLPLIKQGFGIGFLAEITAERLVEARQLVSVLPNYYLQELQLSLVYPVRKQMAKRTRLLVDFIYEKLGQGKP